MTLCIGDRDSIPARCSRFDRRQLISIEAVRCLSDHPGGAGIVKDFPVISAGLNTRGRAKLKLASLSGLRKEVRLVVLRCSVGSCCKWRRVYFAKEHWGTCVLFYYTYHSLKNTM